MKIGKFFLDKILIIIIGFAALLRVPSLFEPYWYGDEMIYLTLGEGMRQGEMLYKEIFDHKPQAIYALAALAGSLFWFKFILLVWHTVTITLFWNLAKVLFTKQKPVVLSTIIFALLTTIPLIEGNLVNSEILMAGPTIGALLILLRAKKLTYKKLITAGLLFSLAFLFKVPAIFDFLALATFWLVIANSRKELFGNIKKLLILLSAFLSPIIVSIVYYWSRGALVEYISTTFLFNFTYIALWDPQAAQIATPLLEQAKQANLPTRGVILVLILGMLFLTKGYWKKTTLFASIWLTFALFASLLSARPYPHYLIQTIAPLAILISVVIFGERKQKFLPLPIITLLAASLVFYQFYYYPTFAYYRNFIEFMGGKPKEQYFAHFDGKTPRTYRIANYINERTTKYDKLFIWGTAPEIYALSRRIPPGRFVTSFHIKDFAGEEETIEALKKDMPKYILVLKTESRNFESFFDLLYNNYIQVKSFDNEFEAWKLVSHELIKALRN